MYRNQRGQLPSDMNHRVDITAAFEAQGDIGRKNKDQTANKEELSPRDPENMMTRLPINVNKTKHVDEFDNSPDYVFMIKKNWAPLLISELVMLNLKVTEMSCN
jgi:hypothetical protein